MAGPVYFSSFTLPLCFFPAQVKPLALMPHIIDSISVLSWHSINEHREQELSVSSWSPNCDFAFPLKCELCKSRSQFFNSECAAPISAPCSWQVVKTCLLNSLNKSDFVTLKINVWSRKSRLECHDTFDNTMPATSEEECKGVQFHYSYNTRRKRNPWGVKRHKWATFRICYSLMLHLHLWSYHDQWQWK